MSASVKEDIINFIDKKPNSLTSEILENLGYETWTVLEALDELKDEGCLE